MIPAAASTVKLVAIRQTYTYSRQFAVRTLDLCAHEVRCEKRIPLGRHTWRCPCGLHFPSSISIHFPFEEPQKRGGTPSNKRRCCPWAAEVLELHSTLHR